MPLLVSDPPDMTLDNKKAEYLLGEMVTCSADAHPQAVIYWLNEYTGERVYNTTLYMTLDMKGYQNEIRGEVQMNYMTLPFRVKVLTYHCLYPCVFTMRVFSHSDQ